MMGQAVKDISLSQALAEFFSDPLGFVHFSFSWGSGQLKNELGPD